MISPADFDMLFPNKDLWLSSTFKTMLLLEKWLPGLMKLRTFSKVVLRIILNLWIYLKVQIRPFKQY